MKIISDREEIIPKSIEMVYKSQYLPIFVVICMGIGNPIDDNFRAFYYD